MKYSATLLIVPFASCTHTTPTPNPEYSATERKMMGLMEKFDRWDEDGNSRLNHAELALGLAGSDHQPANVLAFYDINRDGSLSLHEVQTGYDRADEADAIIRKRNIPPHE